MYLLTLVSFFAVDVIVVVPGISLFILMILRNKMLHPAKDANLSVFQSSFARMSSLNPFLRVISWLSSD